MGEGRLRAVPWLAVALVVVGAPAPPTLPQPRSHLIIHGGPHKSGSTHVQYFLYEHAALLAANGWHSLARIPKQGCLFVNLEVAALYGRLDVAKSAEGRPNAPWWTARPNVTRPAGVEEASGDIWEAAYNAAIAPSPRAILSSECFDADLLQIDPRRLFLAELASRLRPLYARITIAFVYREPRVAHLASVYGNLMGRAPSARDRSGAPFARATFGDWLFGGLGSSYSPYADYGSIVDAYEGVGLGDVVLLSSLAETNLGIDTVDALLCGVANLSGCEGGAIAADARTTRDNPTDEWQVFRRQVTVIAPAVAAAAGCAPRKPGAIRWDDVSRSLVPTDAGKPPLVPAKCATLPFLEALVLAYDAPLLARLKASGRLLYEAAREPRPPDAVVCEPDVAALSNATVLAAVRSCLAPRPDLDCRRPAPGSTAARQAQIDATLERMRHGGAQRSHRRRQVRRRRRS